MYKKLNIIALNIPWPANYGGVIDIYYKIKALHDCGVKIILHCFEYERPHAPELEQICEEVHYYRRHTGLLANLTTIPYNVYSRKNSRLIDNLLKNNYPILFEGLHSCYYLNDKRLNGRFKIFRECNIEHDYYRELCHAENNLIKKCFFYIEAKRFKWYQKHVQNANLMIAVSTADTNYLKKIFPNNRVEFMPCFHENDEVTSSVEESSDAILYHAKLSVKENEKAALFLIKNVFSKLPEYRCFIAGMNPSNVLIKAAMPYQNIVVAENPSSEVMDKAIRTAQINMLVTFQSTGLKLKLLNSLFAGRHVVVNSMMLTGSGLDELCHVADTPEKMIAVCRELMQKPFTIEMLNRRKELLFPTFSNKYQAERLIQFIYGHH